MLEGSELNDEDLIAFGRLNSVCVLGWYEPMVSLVRESKIDPELGRFLKRSVLG